MTIPFFRRGRTEDFPYRREELKGRYRQRFLASFVAAAIGHLLAGATFLTAWWYTKQEPKALTVRIIRYSDLGPPPSLTDQTAAPQIQVAQTVVRPTVGIPEPVPDAEVTSETTIATQAEMSQMTSIAGDGEGGSGSSLQVEGPAPPPQDRGIVVEEDALPEVGQFVPVEEQPAPVTFPAPAYPEVARRSGLEGVVYIQILIDRTGRVRNTKIVKGPEIFHQSAMEAALQSVWRPAIQNQKPVAVWVAYPVRFRLIQ